MCYGKINRIYFHEFIKTNNHNCIREHVKLPTYSKCKTAGERVDYKNKITKSFGANGRMTI